MAFHNYLHLRKKKKTRTENTGFTPYSNKTMCKYFSWKPTSVECSGIPSPIQKAERSEPQDLMSTHQWKCLPTSQFHWSN